MFSKRTKYLQVVTKTFPEIPKLFKNVITVDI